MFVCCECCVLSGRGLCEGLIIRPEESYRLWCVVVCDLEKNLKNEEAMTHDWAASAIEKQKRLIMQSSVPHATNLLPLMSIYLSHCLILIHLNILEANL